MKAAGKQLRSIPLRQLPRKENIGRLALTVGNPRLIGGAAAESHVVEKNSRPHVSTGRNVDDARSVRLAGRFHDLGKDRHGPEEVADVVLPELELQSMGSGTIGGRHDSMGISTL